MTEILSYLDKPRSEFDNIEVELIGTDPLEMFVWAHKMAQLAETVMNYTKDQAVAAAEAKGDSGTVNGDKFTIKRSYVYTYNDNQLETIIGEIDKFDKQTKALKASRKAREELLQAEGKANLVETKTTIAISKK